MRCRCRGGALSPPKGKGGALPLQIVDQLLRKAALIGCGSSALGFGLLGIHTDGMQRMR